MPATTTTYNRAARTLIAAGTSVPAGTWKRGPLNLNTSFGGSLTSRILNANAGITTQAECKVYIAHSVTQPAIPADNVSLVNNADWKFAFTLGGGGVTVSTTVPTDFYATISDAMWLLVEIGGNLGAAVTGEAFFSETYSATTV